MLQIIYTAVSTAPVITQQPTNQTVATGGTATFSVTATGSPTLRYLWFLSPATLIANSTSPTLTISNVQPSNAGHYFVIVSNMFGTAASSNAVLTVTPTGPTGSGLIVPNYSATNQIPQPNGTLTEVLRMQMVYGASEFPPYPITITEIRWRPDQSLGGSASVTISNLLVKLSTTVKTPDHLSTVFAENTGTNETVVFDGSATVSTAFTSLSDGTKAFDISLPLQTPFVFDSTKGSLLVDLRNLLGAPSVKLPNGAGGEDAVSRVIAFDPDATNAWAADTGGDVLQIIYTAVSTAPVITQQPSNQTASVGSGVTFLVTATGSPTLHYQWYGPAGTAIPGAVNSALNLPNVQPTNAGTYFVVVTNGFGFAISSNAILTVSGNSSNMAPVITHQPTNRTVAVGGTANFSVTATGAPALHYQWFGPSTNPIAGAMNPTLTLSNAQPSQAGPYFVLVTNAFGFAVSSNAILTVTGNSSNTPPVIAHLPTINLAIKEGALHLTWPVGACDFTLQASSSQMPVTWTNVPVAPQTNGDCMEVVLPASNPHGFFRLHHP